MLDLHALADGTGSTSLIRPITIPSGDGQVVAGVPMLGTPGRAVLVAWGAIGLASANGPKEVALKSNDLNDPPNFSDWKPGGTSLAPYCSPHLMERLPYISAARGVYAAQKAAGLELTFTIDHYQPGDVRATGVIQGSRFPARRGLYSQAFGGALTAQAWGSVGLTPTYNLPAGRYAILGFTVSAITNVALIRFSHADFGVAKPGCMGVDKFVLSTTLGIIAGDELLSTCDLIQFVRLSEILGQPQCPVFSAGPNGTGLAIECLDNTADTPTVVLNLAYLGV